MVHWNTMHHTPCSFIWDVFDVWCITICSTVVYYFFFFYGEELFVLLRVGAAPMAILRTSVYGLELSI
jgi:hypothetical protein